MTDTMKISPPLDQLGLPPMELAESSNERGSRFLYSCVYPTLQKMFVLLFIATFSAGLYVLLLKILDSPDMNSRSTEIIIVTGSKESPNITLHENDMHIFFKIANSTSNSRSRRKRSTINLTKPINIWNQDDLQKAKQVIFQHQTLCHEKENEEVCNELFDKLYSIIRRNKVESPSKEGKKGMKRNVGEHNKDAISPVNLEKPGKLSLARMRTPIHKGPSTTFQMSQPNVPRAHIDVSPKVTDACLLAKLLKRSYPHVHGYDPPSSESIDEHYNQHSYMRYIQPSAHSFSMQSRDAPKHKLHPQDVEIFMSFLTPKPEISEKQIDANLTSRVVACPSGTLPCDGSEDCIDEKHWCDGNVDCADASDETRCSCKSRVDESRLCDGYFDCPFGEDEMGCFGCSENTFSCKDINQQSQSTCYTKEQRCNNQIDCPNSKDEIECNMLAPSLLKNPLFAVSGTQGYLHRNFKGDWYAVCENPYMWAHDVCRRETGLMIRPPFIQTVPIDPLVKINYLNAGPADSIQPSDTCFNSSAVYVTCPDFICGTRVSATSQLLRGNTDAENHLYGRNKRFLYPGFPGYLYDPYRMMYYGNRMKRDTGIDSTESKHNDLLTVNDNNEARNKRAESRVVGGKPSQPADWPWMVAIYRNGMFHCGGVVFTQSWVISAAHCVAKFWDYHYEVQVGMLRRFSFSPQEQNHRVTHIIVNQHYSQVDMKDDLSLLKVDPAIQFSRWVRPICLPGPNTAGSDWRWGPKPNTMCTAVGWGATVEHGPDPDHLREVEVPVWKQCKHREDRAGGEICAGLVEGGRDACQGDSGGPLLCRNPLNSQQWYLAGIVSHGDGCARENEPGVYTRISLFVKWIKYHTSSKILPLVKPLSECPGFKCKSGISKCLPLIRKCDKIVDCLNAEDEIGCDYTNMRSANEIFSKINKTDEIVSEKRESVLSPISLTGETVSLTETTTDLIESMFTNSTEVSIVYHSKPENEPMETTIDTKASDFIHASTFEVSPSSSIESDSDSSENITEGPISSEKGDTEYFTVTFVPEKLEPRSSVIEEPENHTGKDITRGDEIPFTMTTPSDMIDLESQATTVTVKTNSEESSSDDKIMDDLDNNIPKSKEELNILKNDSIKLIVDLLPKSETTTQPDDVLTDSKKIINDQLAETSNDELSAKNLPDRETQNNLLDKIEDIVFSELQPATIRRKHLVPKEFECKRIFQVISFNQRCDHKADCEDGTDELGCDCSDYLSAYDQNLLCDGVFDCSDGQDEMNCYSCTEQHFLCKRSEICLPLKYVCDGKPQCPLGEDELNCFALSNGREMIYDIDKKPKINLEGYLTKRIGDDWQVVCEDDLPVEQLEESSTHICHYLGFSSANRYTVKYINIKEDLITSGLEHKRSRRNINDKSLIHFAYRSVAEHNNTARNIVIKEPQLLKEECIRNVTKTCKSLYVYCDRSLYTNFDISQNMIYNRAAETSQDFSTHMWPWVAKVYVDGQYRCTGILVDESWVLISSACLWDSLPTINFVSVILGSHRTIQSVGLFEKSHKADSKKELYNSKAVLLHLKVPVEISNNVKPMVISSSITYNDQNTICLAVGENLKNETISVFLNETRKDCKLNNRCFVRRGKENICPNGSQSGRQWAGLISCHNEQGWYPAASFVDSRGECNLGQNINATGIEHLKQEIRYYSGKDIKDKSINDTDSDHCEGVRCSRGRCILLKEVCDGVTHCEDGKDEVDESCSSKQNICDQDPYHTGCECSHGQLKCKNGKCISKELFRDGNNDCGDGTDEPLQSGCSDYIARVMPSKLCDGIVHCLDRSDEDPVFCKCFAKQTFNCGFKSGDEDHCVAPDMVCDGVRDCPNGADERNCIGLSAPKGTPYGLGQVIVQTHGVWRSKCYPTQNHTKSELEAICRELGFLSGHAKEIKEIKHLFTNTPNNLVLEPFSQVILNNQTVIKMRNSNEPMAKAVFDVDLKNCYPVFIECI